MGGLSIARDGGMNGYRPSAILEEIPHAGILLEALVCPRNAPQWPSLGGLCRFTTALRLSSLCLKRPKLRRPTAGIGCASAFYFLTRVLERLWGIPSSSWSSPLRKRYKPWHAAKLLYIGISTSSA